MHKRTPVRKAGYRVTKVRAHRLIAFRGVENVRRRAGNFVRYAVIGAGYIAQAAVLPAFSHARRNSKLVALFSDDKVKRRELGRKYHIPQAASYKEYDAALESGEIDAVYIALPNSLHCEFAIKAAKARLEEANREAERAERDADLERAAELAEGEEDELDEDEQPAATRARAAARASQPSLGKRRNLPSLPSLLLLTRIPHTLSPECTRISRPGHRCGIPTEGG